MIYPSENFSIRAVQRRGQLKAKLGGALFVAVTKEAYEDFLNGKKYEVRRLGKRWSEDKLNPSRAVVIGRGYSGPRLRGVIGKRIVIGSMDRIFYKISFLEVEPRCKDKEEAIRINRELLGESEKYIAFEVIL